MFKNSEMDSVLREHPDSMANNESFNLMIEVMSHVFKYLEVPELLLSSLVCTAWNTIAMDRFLWQTVRLKNSMVCNWNKCIDALNDRGSVSLDMRHMLINTNIIDIDFFWLDFTNALQKAKQLKCLELYRCPAYVFEYIICSLPQLTVLNATSIENLNTSKKETIPYEFMTVNLHSLGQMSNLTELRIKGHTGIKLKNLPSFESLVNLKSLSLTSIRVFPEGICCTLGTLPINLEFLEIGNCDGLSKVFAGVIKRLTNLRSLRLENCSGEFNNIAKEVFWSIRGLDKLKILELINIDFSDNVKEELEKCTNIKALLIIPMYEKKVTTTNSLLIDCLKKLSKTLTHLVLVLTIEMLHVTQLFITVHQPNLDSVYNPELDHISILNTINEKPRPGELSFTVKKKKKTEYVNIDILSVPIFETLLKGMMINAKTKVVKIPFEKTTQVFLIGHFNDL